MGRLRILWLGLALVHPVAATAAQTATHTYDALGRLISSAYTGGPRGNERAGLCYDPAGNRTQYSYSVSAVACPTAPTVPSPVANPDSVPSVAVCNSVTKNVVANDTDPGNRLPLTVLSAEMVSGGGNASVSGTTSVLYDAPSTPGNASVRYVIRNTGGATATGTLSITIVSAGGQCQ